MFEYSGLPICAGFRHLSVLSVVDDGPKNNEASLRSPPSMVVAVHTSFRVIDILSNIVHLRARTGLKCLKSHTSNLLLDLTEIPARP